MRFDLSALYTPNICEVIPRMTVLAYHCESCESLHVVLEMAYLWWGFSLCVNMPPPPNNPTLTPRHP
jgi:hypothetical protein